ncbi:MAG TPA: TetR/AcrR family transcriptional regulator [Burkholderiaceae bacterium]|jgi:AcrR family transcriptional regulator|nr:TetR/AcrR family transcriptional regulator [Burkholderiaceae bacterium]
MSSSAALPVRQRRKEARPQELLDAALDLFVEKGFAATRSEEVAARAGVSKGTLYLYYPSKEELLKAVIVQSLVPEIAEGMDIVRSHTGPTDELLAYILREWWRRIGETKASGICKLMMSEVRNFPDIGQFYIEQVVEPAQQLIGAVIERGIAAGEFRPVPMFETVQALMAPLLFLMLHKHSIGACPGLEGRVNPMRMIEAHVDMVLHGLARNDRKTGA